MKKYVVIFIITSILLLISIVYLGSNVSKYNYKLNSIIKDNYHIEDKLLYINKYDNYYILTTEDNIIVLNNRYQEVLKEDITKIKKAKNMDIIYKNNNLMYLKKEIKNNKVIYKYYDPNNLELIKKITFRRSL